MDSEDIAYDQGHNAHHDGYGLKHNPYKRFTPEWEKWKQGWEDEKKDDPYWSKHRKLPLKL